MKLLLTHVPLSRQNYYGARALARLQELVEVTLHEGDAPLDPQGVIAAARDVDFIIADRSTAVPAVIFDSLPRLQGRDAQRRRHPQHRRRRGLEGGRAGDACRGGLRDSRSSS